MTNAPKVNTWRAVSVMMLGVSTLLVVSMGTAWGQKTESQNRELPYGVNPANLPDAIAKVQSGDFNGMHVEMIARFHAVEAIPALKEQFTRSRDKLTKTQIASALMRLGAKDDSYWNYLVDNATEALNADPPAYGRYDAQGKPLPGPPPEVVQWAKDHHLSLEAAGEQLLFMIPGAILELAITGDERAVPILRRALTSRDPQVEASAARGLALVKDRDSIPLIIDACEKAPRSSAEIVARPLVYFDDPDAQNAVDKFVPKDTARMLRERRAEGKGPFQ